MVIERNAANDVQEGIFHHEKFVKYQRAFEKTVLDPVLQPAQSLPMIELRSRHMSPRADDGVVHKLKDSLEQIRLSCSWRAEEQEGALFTREIQDDLLDVTFSFTEDRDVWHDVWTPALQLEDDAVLVFRGGLAIEDSKHLPLSGAFAQEPVTEESPGSVQRLTTNFHEKFFGFFRLFLR